MKNTLILTFVLTMIATGLYASFTVPYTNSKPPTLSLPLAYERATTALGIATNQFHCISATIATSFSPDGEWFFTFYSTNSTPKWVTVEFSGKVHVEDLLAR